MDKPHLDDLRCAAARAGGRLSVIGVALLLAACASVTPPPDLPPPPPAAAAEPAPPPHAPPVATPPRPPTPDATPRVERIATGHPNRPYEIRGIRYEPQNRDLPMSEIGIASWYGRPFHGRPAATGERYDMHAMTAAHPTMPLPSYARVRNLRNGREVVVRVNDRGPFVGGRIIDLSRSAARRLGFSGLAMVEVVRLTHDDIRTDSWRRRGTATVRGRAHAGAVAQATPPQEQPPRPAAAVEPAEAPAR